MKIADLHSEIQIGRYLLVEAEWDVVSCEAQIVGAIVRNPCNITDN